LLTYPYWRPAAVLSLRFDVVSHLPSMSGEDLAVQAGPQFAVHVAAEGPLTQERRREPGIRVHPQETPGLAEVPEGGRVRLRGGPVRGLIAPDLIPQPPVVVGLLAESGQHTGQTGELHRAGAFGQISRDQGGGEQLQAEGQHVEGGTTRRMGGAAGHRGGG